MKFFKKKVICRDKKPYLIRYTLFTCRLFSVKIHKILLSDYDCHHDHPWSFLSIILKGGYVEHVTEKVRVYMWDNVHYGQEVETSIQTSRLYGPGSILYRPAQFTHKLEIHQPAWTFVVTFKKVREWGFHTPKGWLHWRRYNANNSCE